jgi:hypothetical protein
MPTPEAKSLKRFHGKLRGVNLATPNQVQTLNKRVVWFFEVKSNDPIWRVGIGGENVAKLLHRADESKGMKNWCGLNVLVGRVYRTYATYMTYNVFRLAMSSRAKPASSTGRVLELLRPGRSGSDDLFDDQLAQSASLRQLDWFVAGVKKRTANFASVV